MSGRWDDWEARRIARATKVPLNECTDPVMYNDDMFFVSIDALLEHLELSADPGATYPVVAWCCDAVKPQINIDRWLENFKEQLELADDFELDTVVTDLQGILDAMAAWNAKQTASLYVTSDTRCVLITAADIFDPKEP